MATGSALSSSPPGDVWRPCPIHYPQILAGARRHPNLPRVPCACPVAARDGRVGGSFVSEQRSSGCMMDQEAMNPASPSGRAEKRGLWGRFWPGPSAAMGSDFCASHGDEVQM